MLHLLASVTTTPPSITTGLTDSLTPLFDRVEQLLSDGWDVIQPFLTLRVVLRLITWWIAWRSRGKAPAGPADL